MATGNRPPGSMPPGNLSHAQRRHGLICDMVSLPSARLTDIGELLDIFDAFCEQAGIEEADQFDLRLAIDEVSANVMMHGYAKEAPGPLEVSFCADDNRATITISDRASPFNPDEVPPADLNTPADQREVGGFGWYLVRQVVDGLSYRYDPAYGNVVTLVKRLSRSSAEVNPE
jgi:serine/threonine-protein kinase RsbW